MALARDRTASSLALLLLVLLAGAGSPELLPRNLSGGGAPSMVLPLFLSSPNTTHRATEAGHFRRRQLSTDNARMGLYDDLLANGYYTTRLYIGTPPQEFALIVDSGSTVTYVPCSSCVRCGNHQDPRFQPDLSSTYEPVKCNSHCTCDKKKRHCVYKREYAEKSSSSGVLGEDIISFGKESALKPQRAVFGCENSETGDLFSQHADGIMGLGRGQLSIMDQLVKKGVISDSFSLCYGGMGIGGGAMVLGSISPPPGMVFSHSDPSRSLYYNIELREIHVAGRRLQLDPMIFDHKYGTILDSGTTYAYLPEEAFIELRDAIISKLHSLKQIHGPDPNYNDICFAGAGSDVSQLSKSFPEVDMVFGNGQKLSLSPENYLFRHSVVQGAYCLGIFKNGKDSTTLLGGIIVRNTMVTYDRQHQKIGFWKTNCSELWERLHISGVPSPAHSSSSNTNSTTEVSPALAPPHSSSSNTNSTTEISPALAPSGLQGNFLSGQFQVGLITFDMSLNITYLDLKPHVSELAELIARELGLDSHQIHLMNITSQGNDTLIKWAILPARSSDFISNTTATAILSRLTEHRLHLPENFGSYQLVEWNVEPPSRRTWWQQHLLAIVVGIAVAVLLSFSALLVWYFWRHKFEGQARYRPVGSSVPEQELQQL